MSPVAVTTSASMRLSTVSPCLRMRPADAAAQAEAADAGVADDAAQGGQPVGLGLVVDIAPQGTALHEGRALDRIHRHRTHRRQVDHDPAVAHRGAGDVVTPPRTAISSRR